MAIEFNELEFFKPSELALMNPHQPVKHNLKLTLRGSRGVDSWPEVVVTHNNNIIYKGEVTDEELIIEYTVTELRKRNMIHLSMLNKTINDTQLDEHGNLLLDKSVVLEKVEIDRVKLRPVEDFISFYPDYPDHITDQPRRVIARYMGFNGTLKIYYTNPAPDYFTNKNSLFDDKQVVNELRDNYFKIAEMMRNHS